MKNKCQRLQDIHESAKASNLQKKHVREVEGLCHRDCLNCENSFLVGGWCATNVSSNCLYYSKLSLNENRNIVKEQRDKRSQIRIERYEVKEHFDYLRGKLLYLNKGFLTASLMHRQLRMKQVDSERVMARISCEEGVEFRRVKRRAI